jgi:hypothetical protein
MWYQESYTLQGAVASPQQGEAGDLTLAFSTKLQAVFGRLPPFF